jgi:hypothetical protein
MALTATADPLKMAATINSFLDKEHVTKEK